MKFGVLEEARLRSIEHHEKTLNREAWLMAERQRWEYFTFKIEAGGLVLAVLDGGLGRDDPVVYQLGKLLRGEHSTIAVACNPFGRRLGRRHRCTALASVLYARVQCSHAPRYGSKWRHGSNAKS